METINSWQDIEWSIVESNIFRLQLRIYRAAKEKEYKKLHKLQKLLISSSYAKFLAVQKVTQKNSGCIEVQKFQLATRLILDGKSSPIMKKYASKPDGFSRMLEISVIEDRAKQMLVYLALSPQWEAYFEADSYGFRPGRSVLDAIEAVFIGISKKPKWILEGDILKCFDKINHKYILDKCQTYPNLRKQLQCWLKAGILDSPQMYTPQGGVMAPLLSNITLHGFKEALKRRLYLLGYQPKEARQLLTFVRYADDFVLMFPDKEILIQLKKATQEFLKPIGLELDPKKTRIIHTFQPLGFTFLGFDVVRVKIPLAFASNEPKQKFVTLIKPSKESVKQHKQKLRDIIRQYRGASQERLIQKLNPIICSWALSKRTQISSKIFQSLNAYLYKQLWKWACKRHPKMPRKKLKNKYWHIVGKSKWCFGIKKEEGVILRLQLHSKISIIRYSKVKEIASPFDGNLIYWIRRTGKNFLISTIKAKLIKEQKGICHLCRNKYHR